jgi:hypothetical protein
MLEWNIAYIPVDYVRDLVSQKPPTQKLQLYKTRDTFAKRRSILSDGSWVKSSMVRFPSPSHFLLSFPSLSLLSAPKPGL